MGNISPGEMLCQREGCNHPADWHRLDDSKNVSPTDPNAEFRCVGYDVTRSYQTPQSCAVACPDFVPPPGWEEAIDAASQPVKHNVFEKKT